MIHLSRGGLRVTATDAELAALAASFDSAHAIGLPSFFDADFGGLIDRRLSRAHFQARIENGLVIEETLADDDLFALCLFALNDPAVFTLVERITGCGPFTSFTGRIYRRRRPSRDGEHYYQWHDDVFEGRRVALSVNLSREPYAGGELQLRDAITHAPLGEFANVHWRDALLVRVSESLEHRVAPVAGEAPRTVLAGWFRI